MRIREPLSWKTEEDDGLQHVEVQQWGLRLPNATIAWGTWRGLSFATPTERLQAVAALVKSLEDAGFTPSEAIKEYGWCTRQTEITYYEDVEQGPIDDPDALGVTLEVPQEDVQDDQ